MDPRGCLLPQPWMTSAATRRVLRAIEAPGGTGEGGTGEGGACARFVGGMVRDALLGRPISDIDLATDLSPDRVMARLAAAGIRVVPTGLAHGTVTAVVDGRHFEITTLRRDVETDGRHARIAYTDDWAEDARRRDFTINALFADGDGTFYDPTGGLDDLVQRRVRFVGEPDRRIDEDVLRLLRYYRMLARLGLHGIDEPSRAACRRHAGRLPGLSGERVRGELERILAVPDPRPVLAMLDQDRILVPILPMLSAFDRAARLVLLEPAPDWLRRLAALLDGGRDTAREVATRLRLSRQETARLEALAGPWTATDLPATPRAIRDRLHAADETRLRDRALLAAAEGMDEGGVARDVVAAAAVTARPVFPLKGRDLLAMGGVRGPEVGRVLAAVEAWWMEGDYAADREGCLREAVGKVTPAPADGRSSVV